MKNGRSHRRHSHRRNQTPAVICLPAQKPPISVPRQEPEAARALPLPDNPEALVAANDQTGGYQSRQIRRQALRAEAKAQRRPRLTFPAMPEPAPPVEAALAPLPRNLSLALPRRFSMVAVRSWFRSLIMKRPGEQGQMSQSHAVAHLEAMRTELAHMQRTLDWMLEGAPNGRSPAARS